MEHERKSRDKPTPPWSPNLWQRQEFNEWYWENWTVICKQMKPEPSQTPYTKWIKDLNVRLDTIKLLRGKHRQTTLWHKSQQDLLFTSYSNENKNEWDLIKLKSFCTAKEIINKTKREPWGLEKIFANKATDKGLISKVHKQLTPQPNNEKEMANHHLGIDVNRHFSKDIQMAKRHMKKCSTSLITREMQSKLQWGTTSHWSGWPQSKKSTSKGWRGCGEKEHSYTVDGNVNWASMDIP